MKVITISYGGKSMLLQLDIKNFAIIDKTQINFEENLNTISGETGAGKSKILSAIDVITGGRLTKNDIRTGTEKAELRAVFLKNEVLKEKLKELNIDTKDDYLTIERTINTKGRSIIRINESIQTNQVLKELRKDLVDICGQRDAQKLFKEETYMQLLNERIAEERKEEYAKVYADYKKIKKDLADLKDMDRTQEQLYDLYKFQIKEIEDANLFPEEEEELEKQKNFLDNFEKINQSTTIITQALDATNVIYEAVKEMEKLVQTEPKLKEQYELLKDAYFEIDAVKSEVENYVDNIEFDEYELNKTINRLEEIKKVKKKYGDTIEEILAYYEDIKVKVEKVENRDGDIEFLEEEFKKCEKEIKKVSKELTEERMAQAKDLATRLEKELKELCIENVGIEFDITELDEYNKNGKDKVDLLFSANKGQEKQSLAKVASGGEVSRVLLALKLLSEQKENQTMIFDEVDVGVGGEVGRIIGEKLKALGETTQVLCISHLPQVAAKGHHHYFIEKKVENEKTVSRVKKLTLEERTEEIARMIYGEEKNEITMKQAEEMLK